MFGAPAQPRSKKLSGLKLHTPVGMIGYCSKDEGQPHFRTRMSPLITPELMEAARREYLLHGNVSSKGRCALTPRNFLEKAYTFYCTRLMGEQLSLQGILVRMLRTGLFYPSYSFIAAHGGRGIDLLRGNNQNQLNEQ